MTKAEKKMGIEKPKYDPKKQKAKKPRKSRKKRFAIIIPERPMTYREEKSVGNHTMFTIKRWREMKYGQYREYIDAEKALEDALRKYDRSAHSLIFYEIWRAQIIDLEDGEIIRDVAEERCPVCHSPNIKPDPDFPDTMKDCATCGSEWNDMEVTFNSREHI